MFKSVAACISALLLIGALLGAETVTVRSGNGQLGGTDSSIHFLLGPPTGSFGHAFTPSDFSNAQSGPAAFIVTPNPLWISALSTDASAQWIGTNPNAGLASGNTALYAVSFQITNPFSAATLMLNYSVDDGIGDSFNTGIYVNGLAVCGNSSPSEFHQEHLVTCNVSPQLRLGTNLFYIEDSNAIGAAGILFSATITTTASTPAPTNFTYVPIPGTNNIQTHLMNTFPTGTFIANNALATPFSISNAPGNCGPSGAAPCNYYDGFGPSGSGLSITLNVSVASPTDVYTLMNAYSPPAGEQLATITFLGTGGASLTFPLIGGQDTRDYHVDGFASSLNNGIAGVQAVNAFTCTVPTTCQDDSGAAPAGSIFVFDEQDFSLGTVFAGQTLTQIVLTDTYDGSSPILLGVTVGAPPPTPAPQPTISGVGNGAVYSAGSSVAPGSIATAKGSFLLTPPTIAPSGQPWPTSLAGLSMQFGGIQVPLYYASAAQVNFQVPWELAGRTQAPVTATVVSQTSSAQTVNLAPFSPGLFSTNAEGSGQGAIQDSQYRLVGSSNPASVADVIQIYCTGLGAVTNQPPSGFPAPFSPLAETTTTPTVAIGGTTAQVLYAGLSPGSVGLYQINAQVPAGIATGIGVPVVVTVGGVTSNTVTVAIQPFPPVPNPQPSIAGLSPASSLAGLSSPLTLTINGSGFIPSSLVLFNGLPHTPSFYNNGVLSILLSTLDLSVAGNYPVVVTNPSPGGGTSNTVYFSVTPSVEVINLTGAWQGTWRATLGANGTLAANLSQTASVIGGTISFVNWCFSSGVLSGSISGNQVSLNLTFSGGQKVSFSGATNLPGTAITGQYTVVSGSCVDGSTGGLALGR